MTDNIYVRLLKRAHTAIESGALRHVCIAIQGAAETDIEDEAASRIHIFIRAHLDGRGSVRLWLSDRGYTGTDEDLRAYRLRWIKESLIPIWAEVEEPKE